MNLLTNTSGLISDLFLQISPLSKQRSTYKYAFLVHPRSRSDIERKFSFFKFFPDVIVDIFSKHFWPITISKITGLKSLKTGDAIEGYIISILPTAHQLMEDRPLALKRIIQACKLAERRGVKIIGLGGLTSSLSKGGLDLLQKVNVNITTGHAYTSFNVTQNIIALTDYMGLKKDKVWIGIVGAAGSVGSTSAKILIKEGYTNLLLVDLERKKKNCLSVADEIKEINPKVRIEISHQIGDIKICDLIIAATNAPEALILPKDLKFGAIVIDDAQPSDVHKDVFLRKDVLVVEAGVTHTPDINSNFNFGLKNKYDNFCCLAEVMILAANEWDKHYVINKASLSSVEEISELGKKMGFRIGNFQNFFEQISGEKLDFVKRCIQNES